MVVMGREESVSIVESCFAFLLEEMLDESYSIEDRSSSNLKDELLSLLGVAVVALEPWSELIHEGLKEVGPSIHEVGFGVHRFLEEGLNDELDGFGGRVVGEEGLEEEWEVKDRGDEGEGC